MNSPHPELIPYLDKHGLTWEEFAYTPRGRPKKGDTHSVEVRKSKSDLITDLHSQGMEWNRMCEITGKTVGFIQKYTRATWNPSSRKNSRANGVKTGELCKGMNRTWLSEKLKQEWEDGKFDFHRGRVRSDEERQKLRDSHTPDVRSRMSRIRKELWQTPEFRDKLLAYHRAPEQRARYSRAQSRRMTEDPVKWTRGRGSYVDSQKCTQSRFWVRSSYERAAACLLENCSSVTSFEYEKRFTLPTGNWVKPDFVVTYSGGCQSIVEVKAAWATRLPPDHGVSIQLKNFHTIAIEHGWDFQVWTEEDVLKHVV